MNFSSAFLLLHGDPLFVTMFSAFSVCFVRCLSFRSEDMMLADGLIPMACESQQEMGYNYYFGLNNESKIIDIGCFGVICFGTLCGRV